MSSVVPPGSSTVSYSAAPSVRSVSQGVVIDRNTKIKLLSELLEIESRLLRNSGVDFSLPGYYDQYIACLAAIDKFVRLSSEQKSHLPWAANRTDVIECFIGKSHWHNPQGFHMFSDIQKYPTMVEWLQTDPEHHTQRINQKLWGYHLPKYEWSHLNKWKKAQNDGSANDTRHASESPSKPKKDKGKGKDKDKGKSGSGHKKSKSSGAK